MPCTNHWHCNSIDAGQPVNAIEIGNSSAVDRDDGDNKREEEHVPAVQTNIELDICAKES